MNRVVLVRNLEFSTFVDLRLALEFRCAGHDLNMWRKVLFPCSAPLNDPGNPEVNSLRGATACS